MTITIAPSTSTISHSTTMPQLSISDFIYSLDDVSKTQDCFDEYMLRDARKPDNARFSLATVNISDILDSCLKPIPMTDSMIAENDDMEYIDDLIEAVRQEGSDCFPPVVVLDRGTHYEWLDGQHRLTALHRAGFTTTRAYIQLGDF